MPQINRIRGSQVLSIQSQTTELTDLALKHGLKIDKVFTESMSAKESGRPEFNKMLELIKQKKDCVLFVWKLDRLARNPIDDAYIKHYLQKSYIKEIQTPFGNYYPTDNAILMSVEFGMANQYIRDLSANVKRGNKTKLEKGGLPGKTPFGYLNDQANKTVIVDPARAPYIEKIFRTFATGGHSLKDISTKLYNEGLRTKSGKKIHASMLYRMIINPFYTGLIIRSGKYYQGSHQTLVSSELFNQCKNILLGKHSAKQKHLFPFRGYATCPICGCMITASIRRGHQYYHCIDGKHLHQNGREHFRSETLNKVFALKLQELQFDPEQIEIMYQAALEENRQDHEFYDTAKTNLLNAQKSLALKRSRLEDTYLDGSMSKERYEARILDLNNEEVSLSNQLIQLEKKANIHSNTTIGQTKKAFLTGLFAENDFLNGDDFKKREVVENLVSDLTVSDQKIQQIRFKPAYQMMFETPKNVAFCNWSG